MSLRNLLVSFDIDVSGRGKLGAVDASLKGLLDTVKGVSVGLRLMTGLLAGGAVLGGVASFISSTLTAADALFNQAAKLGMTTDELQKYQYAAASMGVSVQETAVALRFFNRFVGEAQLGTKSANKTLAQLGVSMADFKNAAMTPNQLLLKFSDRLEKIPNQAQRTAFAMRTLGRGGSALLPILQQGSKKLHEVFADVDELGGGFDQAFTESAHEVEVELKKLRMGWRSISVAIVKEFLPALKYVLDFGMKVAEAFVHIGKHTYGFRTALMALAATFAVIGVAVGAAMALFFFAMQPILLPLEIFVALMTALYLAFDDFYTFLMGGDSVLGDFLNRLGGTGAAKRFRQDFVDAFHKVWDAIGPLVPRLEEFGKSVLKVFIESIPAIIEWGGIIGTYVVGSIDLAITGLRGMYDVLKGIAHLVSDIVEGRFSDFLGDVTVLGKKLKNLGGGMGDRFDAYGNLIDKFHKIGAKLGAAPDQGMPIDADGGIGLPPPPKPGAPHAMNINITNNISGVGDPLRTGREVGNATKTAVKTALNERRDAFDAVTVGMPQAGFG